MTKRRRNVRITVEFRAAIGDDLETLLRSGLFGTSLEHVAEGLLLAELRRLALAGWPIGKGGQPKPGARR